MNELTTVHIISTFVNFLSGPVKKFCDGERALYSGNDFRPAIACMLKMG